MRGRNLVLSAVFSVFRWLSKNPWTGGEVGRRVLRKLAVQCDGIVVAETERQGKEMFWGLE